MCVSTNVEIWGSKAVARNREDLSVCHIYTGHWVKFGLNKILWHYGKQQDRLPPGKRLYKFLDDLFIIDNYNEEKVSTAGYGQL